MASLGSPADEYADTFNVGKMKAAYGFALDRDYLQLRLKVSTLNL